MCRVQTGAAWPSSARVLRWSINFCNERNPYLDYTLFYRTFTYVLSRLIIHCVIGCFGIKKLPMRYRMKVGRMSGRHGLNRLGYIRATMVVTVRCDNVNFSKTLKTTLVRIVFCNTKT